LALPLLAMLLLGALVRVNEVQQLAFIGLVQVITLAVLGPQVYRKILFALLFLFFLVPMGEYLIRPLQLFTTQFISLWLTLGGIVHHTEVTTIELANGKFQVAEACAGLRFLIAMMAVGVLFARFYFRKWYKILLFLLACVIVPVIGNGFRALGVVMLAHESNMKIATGFDHVVYGWLFSVLVITVLMFVGLRFADPAWTDEAPPAIERPSKPKNLLLLAIAAALVSCSVPTFLYWDAHKSVVLNKAAFSAPSLPADWSRTPPSGVWEPSYATPDAQMAFGMRKQAALPQDVDVFVNYYATDRDSHSLITSTNKLWDEYYWHPLLQNSVEESLGNQKIQFGQLEIASSTKGTKLILWTYWINGRFTTSAMTVKLDGLRSAFGGSKGSALVAISTTVDSDEDSARVRLRQALSALGSLPGALRAAGNLPAEPR
jgi:EpsI family protein